MSRAIYLGFRRKRSELARHVVAGDSTVQEVKELLIMEHHDWDENFVLFYKGRRLENDLIIENIAEESDSDVIFDVEYPTEDEEAPSVILNEQSEVFDARIEQLNEVENVSNQKGSNAERCKQNVEEVSNEAQQNQPIETQVSGEQQKKSEAGVTEEQKKKSEACKVTILYKGENHEALVRTLGELKDWVNDNLMDSNTTNFSDLTVEGHSILNFASHVLIQDILASAADQSVEVITDKDESGDEAVELLRNIFAIQAERDRIAHINQMAFNSKLTITSLSSLATFVDETFPELREELEMVIKKHKLASKLMSEVVSLNQQQYRRELGSRLVNPGSFGQNDHFERLNNNNLAPNEAAARHARAANIDALPRQDANARNAQAGGNGAQPIRPAVGGVAARVPRVAALIVIDLRLLFKLCLIVGVLGHDAGPREFYFICFIAALVYLASTNMLRLPFVDRLNPGRFGRIPRAEQRGFFIDLWTMVSTFFLSIIPAWQVVADDPPADQVRPVDAAQPVQVPM